MTRHLVRLGVAGHSGSQARWPGRVVEVARRGTANGQTTRPGGPGTLRGQPRERLASVRYAPSPEAELPPVGWRPPGDPEAEVPRPGTRNGMEEQAMSGADG